MSKASRPSVSALAGGRGGLGLAREALASQALRLLTELRVCDSVESGSSCATMGMEKQAQKSDEIYLRSHRKLSELLSTIAFAVVSSLNGTAGYLRTEPGFYHCSLLGFHLGDPGVWIVLCFCSARGSTEHSILTSQSQIEAH